MQITRADNFLWGFENIFNFIYISDECLLFSLWNALCDRLCLLALHSESPEQCSRRKRTQYLVQNMLSTFVAASVVRWWMPDNCLFNKALPNFTIIHQGLNSAQLRENGRMKNDFSLCSLQELSLQGAKNKIHPCMHCLEACSIPLPYHLTSMWNILTT